MARRKKFGRLHRFGKVPPPPKVKGPDEKELMRIYKDIVSASIATRIDAMERAVKWYDTAAPLYMSQPGGQLTPDQIKKMSHANKAKALAVGAKTDQERETAFLTALKLLGKIFTSAPKVEDWWKKYEESKHVLEAQAQSLENRFSELLDVLNTTYGKFGVKFNIVPKADNDREFDPENKTIQLTASLAKSLNHKAKKEGYLSALFSEMKTVITVAGLEKGPVDAAGEVEYVPNLGLMVGKMPEVLMAVLEYCNSVPRQKVFKHFGGTLEAQAAASYTPSNNTANRPINNNHKVPRMPRVQGAPAVPSRPMKNGLVAGLYKEGTAIAEIYHRLSDEKPHPLSDVLKDLPGRCGDPIGRFRWIVKHAHEYGKWKVDQHGNTVQLTFIGPKP